jgi:acetyl-CoA acetyltransferase
MRHVSIINHHPSPVDLTGGAMTPCHPPGCSGARIVSSPVHVLRRRDGCHGLAPMCVGVGRELSTVVEAA